MGRSALWYALVNCSKSVVKAVLKAGGNANLLKDAFGRDAIQLAIE
jgi:hypothetical protein